MTDSLIENYLYFTETIIAAHIRLNLLEHYAARSLVVQKWQSGSITRLEQKIEQLKKIRNNL